MRSLHALMELLTGKSCRQLLPYRVVVAVLQSFLTREKLMESRLYREIFQEGEAKGKAEGEAKSEAKSLIRLLTLRLGLSGRTHLFSTPRMIATSAPSELLL